MNLNLHALHLKANKLAYARACEKNGVQSPQQHTIFNEYVEIFAELIVTECASIELYWLNGQDRKSVAEKIKEHFGVKND